MTVIILMATYNGVEYLPQQLDSIRHQTYSDWVLLCRDDASTDGTLHVLREYAALDPRIRIAESGGVRRGVVGNFAELIGAALAEPGEYFVFSDQDDVWRPTKLDVVIAKLRGLERQFGECSPLLVHSDLVVVDERLNVIRDSFMKFQGYRHESAHPLSRLLAENFVTGCTVGCNRALLRLAFPVPADAIMHDWWLALCAGLAGRVDFIEMPTVLYRQHPQNVLGAKGGRRIAAFWRKGYSERFSRYRFHFWRTVRQAQALLDRTKDPSFVLSSPEVGECLAAYAGLGRQRPLQRVVTLWRHGVRKHSLLENILMIAAVLLSPIGDIH